MTLTGAYTESFPLLQTLTAAHRAAFSSFFFFPCRPRSHET